VVLGGGFFFGGLFFFGGGWGGLVLGLGGFRRDSFLIPFFLTEPSSGRPSSSFFPSPCFLKNPSFQCVGITKSPSFILPLQPCQRFALPCICRDWNFPQVRTETSDNRCRTCTPDGICWLLSLIPCFVKNGISGLYTGHNPQRKGLVFGSWPSLEPTGEIRDRSMMRRRPNFPPAAFPFPPSPQSPKPPRR